MSAVIEAGERDFDSALAGPKPFLVDFSASWCGPCKAMAPALEAFAERRSNDLPVLKVDIDAAPGLANRYGIRSVPTLMLFKDGKPVATQPGMMSESQLASFVGQNLPPRERTPVEQDPGRPQIKLDW
ncbi:MAG: trxA [Ramlibacter sp.]|nr:trxA [Ramlibacter sp.]